LYLSINCWRNLARSARDLTSPLEQADANLKTCQAAAALTPIGGDPTALIEIDDDRIAYLVPKAAGDPKNILPPTGIVVPPTDPNAPEGTAPQPQGVGEQPGAAGRGQRGQAPGAAVIS